MLHIFSFEGVFVLEGMTLFDSLNIRNIHFIGIGGSSMSGLAEILKNLGYTVSGSDMKTSEVTKKLENIGITVYPFHNEENIKNPDLVVYTVAVKEDNPEIIKARSLNIPVIDRATLLGEIMKTYPFSIAISGTHGKTTTTSMVSTIMLESKMDPTIHIGGELSIIGGNTKIGGHKYFITEACEYFGSFLKFHPFLAVILNIELDHVDYFKDIEHIKDTFFQFASLVPKDGYVVACVDDVNVCELLGKLSCNIITYGISNEEAIWSAKSINFDGKGCASYTLTYKGEKVADITLSVPGIHNVSNSIAAAASCYALGCTIDAIKDGLYKFTGTHRRFETKGAVDGIRVVDDYAHHPSEVRATLKAAKNMGYSKIWCVFQPHTYTRTKSLMREFASAFSCADTVIVSDIYAAREKDSGEVHASMLAEKLVSQGVDAIYISSFEAIVDFLENNASPGSLIITMGAGDIYKVGEMFLKRKEDPVAVNL